MHSRSHDTKNKQHTKQLRSGSYTEVSLKAEELGYMGIADLVSVSKEDGVEIIDFKTGSYSEKHIFQIQAYSVIWAKDQIKNPAGREADKLILCYSGQEMKVDAPHGSDIDQLVQTMLLRRANALASLANGGKPNVNINNCRHCIVRQLCQEYWANLDEKTSIERKNCSYFNDIQVRKIRQHASFSWDAEVEHSSFFSKNANVVLRAHPDSFEWEKLLNAGTAVRVLDAIMGIEGENSDILTVNLTSASELFVI